MQQKQQSKIMTFENRYDHKIREKYWQEHWELTQVYAFKNDREREQTFVIDTPPPTVSGQLHMGHIYSYTHADFIARHRRMKGFDVFYPMGFDDNGLPTERLVQKQKKIRAKDVTREEFISLCEGVSQEARLEFRSLFSATALSVDWALEYHTISEEVRRLSQASFIDLYEKGHIERKLQPMLWDVVDQTAIAQAEVEDKELEGVFVDIRFEVAPDDSSPLAGEQQSASDAWGVDKNSFVIGTTRPEMLPACVGIFYHPDDERYKHLKDKFAITPLFGVRVPILSDESVEMEKGTGIMMCCTFGDEADIIKWRKHNLETKIIINQYGKIDPILLASSIKEENVNENNSNLWVALSNLSAKAARTKMIELLQEASVLVSQRSITHAVKCAERSGAPLEILPSEQWFIKVTEHKEALKKRSQDCNWNPAWMQKRMEQWIDGLNWDWCISRQRIYGVPLPVWYVIIFDEKDSDNPNISQGKVEIFLPSLDELPINPIKQLPKSLNKILSDIKFKKEGYWEAIESRTGYNVLIRPDTDVMDTWATSSLTPQISAGAINCFVTLKSPHPNPLPEGEGVALSSALEPSPFGRGQGEGNTILGEGNRKNFNKLFPADLRPQAHEIIRTWAFYTLVKSYLHNKDEVDIKKQIPWENLMISGWCLSSDKTKMSKSKGNVITPLKLLEEKSADAVRHWASTAKLGTDTAFSEDLLKIGAKLTNKLWNAAKFVSTQLEAMQGISSSATAAVQTGIINCEIDKWLISRVQHAIIQCDKTFNDYDYSAARAVLEFIFWNDFCDNYLEIVKARAYGQQGEGAQQSALHTIYHVFNAILKLFAPFIPHITEELFAKLYEGEFTQCGSIHARGNFPIAENYQAGIVYQAAEQNWHQVKMLVELIRKTKSERGVSIKYPIAEAGIIGINPELFVAISDDIKAVGNIATLHNQQLTQADSILQDGEFQLSVVFAAEAEVA